MKSIRETKRLNILKFELLLLLCILLSTTISFASYKEIVTFLFTAALFILPGLIFSVRVFDFNYKDRPEFIIFGCCIGIVSSSFIAAMAGYFIKWDIYIVSIVLLIFSPLLYFLLRVIKKDPIRYNNNNQWSNGDYNILLFFLIILTISIIFPYANVGKMTEHGVAFSSLLSNDFVAHMNFTASLSQRIPPEHFHFSGNILRYYWLSLILPAFIYRLSGYQFSLINVMLLTQLLYSLLFVGTLFCLFRSVILPPKKGLFLTMLLSLCAYSFNDIYVLCKILANKLSPSWLLALLQERRLLDFSNLSKGFFRFFILEPQTVLAFCILSICLYLIFHFSDFEFSLCIFSLIGFLSGLIFGIEKLTGMLLFSIVEFFVLFKVIEFRHNKMNIKKTILGIILLEIILILTYSTFFSIKMFSLSQINSTFIFKINNLILLTFPLFTLLTFGPATVFGSISIGLKIKNRELFKYYPFFILLIFSFMLILFIDLNYPGIPSTSDIVVVKGSRTILLALLIFSGLFLANIKKRAAITFSILLICMAIPTLFIDIYTLSNISYKKKTIYISQSDLEAAYWIKNNISHASVIQPFSMQSSYAIATFGERRVALGWPLSYITLHDNTAQVSIREKDIEQLFRTEDIREMINLIKKYNIKNIYIGIHDKMRLKNKEYLKFFYYSNIFKNIYSKNKVDIFQYLDTNFPVNYQFIKQVP